MRKNALTETAKAKQQIQVLLRSYAIQRDGGCVFAGRIVGNFVHECGGYAQDGHLILQYDHLVPRERNISYANPDLGVLVCKGIHGWKSFSDVNKEIYDNVVRWIIGPERCALWDRVKEDHKSYHMSAWDWNKQIIYLKSLINEPS